MPYDDDSLATVAVALTDFELQTLKFAYAKLDLTNDDPELHRLIKQRMQRLSQAELPYV